MPAARLQSLHCLSCSQGHNSLTGVYNQRPSDLSLFEDQPQRTLGITPNPVPYVLTPSPSKEPVLSETHRKHGPWKGAFLAFLPQEHRGIQGWATHLLPKETA